MILDIPLFVFFALLTFLVGMFIAAVIIGGAIIRTDDPKSRLAYIETCIFSIGAILLASYLFLPAVLYHALSAAAIATVTWMTRFPPDELLDMRLPDIV